MMIDSDYSVALVSVRNLRKQAANCTLYEFEDIISSLQPTSVFSPSSERRVQRKIYRSVKKLSRSNRISQVLSLYPSQHSIPEDCALILVVVDNPYQLHLLNELHSWRKHPAPKACYLSELWPGNLRDPLLLNEPFSDFDHIFVGLSRAVPILKEKLDVSCSYLPLGVDTKLFSARALSYDRSIDLSFLGRRDEAMHQALVTTAEVQNLFYQFDTLASPSVNDHRLHRKMYATFLNRAKFSFAFPAKKNLGGYTDGVDEIGSRYYELAAAGSIVLGEKPDTPYFSEYFGWEDSVIDVDVETVSEIIRELLLDKKRMKDISTMNAKHCLKRHDWVYRWHDILSRFSLKPSSAVRERIQELDAIALSL